LISLTVVSSTFNRPKEPKIGHSSFAGGIFQLDLFINDPAAGYQPSGWPTYLATNASQYTNVAGISFIQPSDLMNSNYDLPQPVGAAVHSLRKQGVAVQLLVGGEISNGWSQLKSNPAAAARTAIALMKKYDCGLEIDDEEGGNSAGLISFIKAVAAGKPSSVHLSIDVAGTPTGDQIAVTKGAINALEWINLMVSNPFYDQSNSMNFAKADGFPLNKLLLAYYAGTWVNNCNSVGSSSSPGDTARGLQLVQQNGLKGLSIWAVGGASYGGCGTGDAPGFAQAMKVLG